MSIRNFDFLRFYEKIWISLISALYCGFTLGYMHFADPRTNAGALSTIGLDHRCCCLWVAALRVLTFCSIPCIISKAQRAVPRSAAACRCGDGADGVLSF